MNSSPERRRVLAAVALAATAVYARTVSFQFLLDDVLLIVENHLLKSWASLPRLLSTEFVSAAVGHAGRFCYFRPVTSLYFFLQYRLWGEHAGPFHLTGVLLHAAVSALLYACLRRDWNPRAAAAAALAFAVLPVHVDAVVNIASQTEVLALLGMLGAWWFLGPEAPGRRETALGLLCFAAAAGSKEPAVLFPAAYAAADWTLRGRRPDHPARRAVYAGLGAVLVLFLIARTAVAGTGLKGGLPYFAGVSWPVRLLTLAGFWARHYLVPLVTGAFQGIDFTQPLLPLASPGDPAAWALLLGGLAIVGAAAREFPRRSPWAFWLFLAALFLLPSSQLLNETDTIGAERYLYAPSLAWCAAIGWAADRGSRSRWTAPALAALLLWYGGRTLLRSGIWSDELSFFTASVRENPVAASPRYSLGVALIRSGRTAEGEAQLRRALELGPREPGVYYNIGRLAWERGDLQGAEAAFRSALRLQADDADTLTALGMLAERRGAAAEAEARYREAVASRPWDPRARYSLGRLLAAQGRKEAASHLREFLRLAPDDPLAPAARRLLKE